MKGSKKNPVKVGGFEAADIIGPVFFNLNVNSERSSKYILKPFKNQLTDHERQIGHFQQDFARAHTARATITYLRQIFGDRIRGFGQAGHQILPH
jgi:hypothetical protein